MTKKHSQINIHIDQLDILENQFDHNKLSYDFNEYINYQLLGIPLSELIQINIHSKQKISEREQEQFISKFVQHYEHQITSYDFASKYIFRKVLILFLIPSTNFFPFPVKSSSASKINLVWLRLHSCSFI